MVLFGSKEAGVAPTTLNEPQRRERPQPHPTPNAGVLTTAETAECTCPEPCERDHDRD